MTGSRYSEAVLAHFREPQHAGSFPAGTPGVSRGEAGSSDEGRLVRIELTLAGDAVDELRFKAFGCPATIAAASYVAGALRGCPRARAEALGAEEIARELDLSAERLAAAEVVAGALQAALAASRRAT